MKETRNKLRNIEWKNKLQKLEWDKKKKLLRQAEKFLWRTFLSNGFHNELLWWGWSFWLETASIYIHIYWERLKTKQWQLRWCLPDFLNYSCKFKRQIPNLRNFNVYTHGMILIIVIKFNTSLASLSSLINISKVVSCAKSKNDVYIKMI